MRHRHLKTVFSYLKVLTVTCSHWDWLKVSPVHDLINQKFCVMDQSSVALAGAIGIRNKRSSGDQSYLTVLLFSSSPLPHYTIIIIIKTPTHATDFSHQKIAEVCGINDPTGK